MTVNEQITDSVTQANVKVLGDAPAEAMGMLYTMAASAAGLAIQNAVANQQRQQAIDQAATTMGINKLLNMDPAEAVSVVKTMTGNDLAQQMSALIAALGTNQQAVKAAVSTPPETAAT